MSKFVQSLDQEIDRRVHAAIRKALKPMQVQLAAEQKRVNQLEKELVRLRKAKGLPAKTTASAKAKTKVKSAGVVRDLRSKHALSQRAVSLLTDVSLNTVWLWEQGRTSPRAAQANQLQSLLQLGPTAMRNRLAKVGLKEGKSKPGRKAGSGKKAPKKAAKRAAKASRAKK
jgi:DNA-binding transcriptional regulator YiaG